jgi:lipoprotein signal peptidase
VLARLLISGGEEPARWIPLAIHISTAIIFLIASLLILRSERLKDVYKAMFSIVPIAVLLVYTGMFLYNWPIAVYAVSVVIVAAILFYLYRTKRPWMYYYALFLISTALLYMQITGIDI